MAQQLTGTKTDWLPIFIAGIAATVAGGLLLDLIRKKRDEK